MSTEFVRVNATDIAQRGARFRLTYERGKLTGWAATSSMPEIWAALPSLKPGAVVISPVPSDGPVAVIDVKAPANLPSGSVAWWAGTLDAFAFVSLTKVEAIDAVQLTATTAAAERAEQTTRAVAEREARSPFNVFGDVTSTLKWLAVAAVVVTVAYVALKYVPPKRRRT